MSVIEASFVSDNSDVSGKMAAAVSVSLEVNELLTMREENAEGKTFPGRNPLNGWPVEISNVEEDACSSLLVVASSVALQDAPEELLETDQN